MRRGPQPRVDGSNSPCQRLALRSGWSTSTIASSTASTLRGWDRTAGLRSRWSWLASLAGSLAAHTLGPSHRRRRDGLGLAGNLDAHTTVLSHVGSDSPNSAQRDGVLSPGLIGAPVVTRSLASMLAMYSVTGVRWVRRSISSTPGSGPRLGREHSPEPVASAWPLPAWPLMPG